MTALGVANAATVDVFVSRLTLETGVSIAICVVPIASALLADMGGALRIGIVASASKASKDSIAYSSHQLHQTVALKADVATAPSWIALG